MLHDLTLFGAVDNVQIAIDRLKMFEPEAGYWVGFSGGKDSQVILDLCKRAEVKYDAHYSQAMEPPELVQFIRNHYPDVSIERPKETMWELVVAHSLPPTRLARYCCQEMKETGGAGRLVVTGIRWAESIRRRNRRMVEQCNQDRSKSYLHPIIDWTDWDVWEYHRLYIPAHCSLYDEGFKRIGCVLCPMNRNPKRDIARWPKIADAYRRACGRAFEKRKARGDVMRWHSGDDMFEWWISQRSEKGDESSPVLFE